MYQRNLYLIQIEHANRLAHSTWPQEKRLALILLENLFELALKRKAESELYRDYVSWDGGRQIPAKQRQKIQRFYDELLKFTCSKNLITAEEKAILEYVHEIRNEIYHGPRALDEDKVELGIALCCELIRKDPLRWISKGSGYFAWSTAKGFENRYFSGNHFLSTNIDQEILDLLPKLLTYGSRKKLSANVQLENLVSKEIQMIRWNLSSLREAIGEVDFNKVFRANGFFSNIAMPELGKASKQGQLELVLAYHECIAILKEELSDIDNTKVRYEKFAELFKNKIKSRPQYPFDYIKKFNKKSLRFSKISTAQAIIKTKTILDRVERISISSGEAASALSDYIQHEYDRYKGK